MKKKTLDQIILDSLYGRHKMHRARIATKPKIEVFAACRGKFKFTSLADSDVTCLKCKKVLKAEKARKTR